MLSVKNSTVRKKKKTLTWGHDQLALIFLTKKRKKQIFWLHPVQTQLVFQRSPVVQKHVYGWCANCYVSVFLWDYALAGNLQPNYVETQRISLTCTSLEM